MVDGYVEACGARSYSCDLIIVRSILNFVAADRACGSLAGMMVNSPFFSRMGLPDMMMSASPSSM